MNECTICGQGIWERYAELEGKKYCRGCVTELAYQLEILLKSGLPRPYRLLAIARPK